MGLIGGQKFREFAAQRALLVDEPQLFCILLIERTAVVGAG
jgi:hypothetical protein